MDHKYSPLPSSSFLADPLLSSSGSSFTKVQTSSVTLDFVRVDLGKEMLTLWCIEVDDISVRLKQIHFLYSRDGSRCL